MIKNYIFLIIIITLICCNDDNSTNPQLGNDPNLVGNWELNFVKLDNELYSPNEFPEIPTRIQFYSEGIGMIWFADYGVQSDSSQILWKTSGNKLIIDEEDEMTYEISGDSLIIKYDEYGTQFELNFSEWNEPKSDVDYDSELIELWELNPINIKSTDLNPYNPY